MSHISVLSQFSRFFMYVYMNHSEHVWFLRWCKHILFLFKCNFLQQLDRCQIVIHTKTQHPRFSLFHFTDLEHGECSGEVAVGLHYPGFWCALDFTARNQWFEVHWGMCEGAQLGAVICRSPCYRHAVHGRWRNGVCFLSLVLESSNKITVSKQWQKKMTCSCLLWSVCRLCWEWGGEGKKVIKACTVVQSFMQHIHKADLTLLSRSRRK